MTELLNQNRELIAAIVGGLVATIGSVATQLTSHYLRQTGKLTVNLSSSEFILSKRDEVGGAAPAASIHDAEEVSLILKLDFYNSSDIPKSLREIAIAVKSAEGNSSFTTAASEHISGSQSLVPYKTLEILNVPPKELLHLELKCWLKREEVSRLKGRIIVSIRATYPNGSRFKQRLLSTQLK